MAYYFIQLLKMDYIVISTVECQKIKVRPLIYPNDRKYFVDDNNIVYFYTYPHFELGRLSPLTGKIIPFTVTTM